MKDLQLIGEVVVVSVQNYHVFSHRGGEGGRGGGRAEEIVG